MEGKTPWSATSTPSELKLSLIFATPITPGVSLLCNPPVKTNKYRVRTTSVVTGSQMRCFKWNMHRLLGKRYFQWVVGSVVWFWSEYFRQKNLQHNRIKRRKDHPPPPTLLLLPLVLTHWVLKTCSGFGSMTHTYWNWYVPFPSYPFFNWVCWRPFFFLQDQDIWGRRSLFILPYTC